jgi:hypothetical protein
VFEILLKTASLNIHNTQHKYDRLCLDSNRHPLTSLSQITVRFKVLKQSKEQKDAEGAAEGAAEEYYRMKVLEAQ